MLRRLVAVMLIGLLIVSFQNCAPIQPNGPELTAGLIGEQHSASPIEGAPQSPVTVLQNNRICIYSLAVRDIDALGLIVRAELSVSSTDCVEKVKNAVPRGHLVDAVQTHYVRVVDLHPELNDSMTVGNILDFLDMDENALQLHVKSRFAPLVSDPSQLNLAIGVMKSYICYVRPARSSAAFQAKEDALHVQNGDDGGAEAREDCVAAAGTLYEKNQKKKTVEIYHYAVEKLDATASLFADKTAALKHFKSEAAMVSALFKDKARTPMTRKIDAYVAPKACSAKTITVKFNYKDISGTLNEEWTCSGGLPKSGGGASGVRGLVPNKSFGIVGTACRLLDAGQNGASTVGRFNNTLSGPTPGTCKHYCNVIADCGTDGVWKNIRHER